jgi:unsaturated rhamnogalacturonyl hydrolase
MQWHYEHGLVLLGMLQLAEDLGDEAMAARVKASYDTLVHPDGSIGTYRKNDFNLDQINPGRTLFELYRRWPESRYRLAIECLMDQLRNQPRTKSGGFWHKQIYPWQIWLDGLYMAGPFYAHYTALFGDSAAYADIIAQFITIEQKTRDTKTGLLYHAWDESRQQLWADPETGCSPHFWGRAMGWYCMALVDVLDYIPLDCPGRQALIAIIQRLVEPVLGYQDAVTGLWYQVLDQGGRVGNYLESSASSMFVYFLCKAQRMGYVDAKAVLGGALKGYQGLVENRLRTDGQGVLHLDGICSVAGLGGNPYRDGSYAYYIKEPVVSDDFKGVGPFLLACLELAKVEATPSSPYEVRSYASNDCK